jgi:glucose/arabinose dehydrogenase
VTGSRRLVVRLVALLLSGVVVAAAMVWWQTRGTGALAPRVSSNVAFPVENPFAGQWAVDDMFPGVTLDRPVSVVLDARHEGKYFVVQQDGLIQTVTAGPPARASTFLDLRSKVAARGEAGLIGFAAHPDYARGGQDGRFVYVFYVTEVNGQLFDRLSRFERLANEDGAAPNSEVILISQLDEDMDHNSGHLVFGPDGFLYVGVGDEGGIGDQFANGQRIDRDLFSGILRLDIDCRSGVSHAIRKQPATGRTQGYCIPSDNPFVGVPGALEEFYAIGFRNPHRFSFDGTTLIGGEVGQDRREEVFIASRGSNHQWSYREGTMPFPEGPLHGERPAQLIGIEANPVYEYAHTDSNGAIIGGYVYRGAAFPELQAKYIFGDYNSGRVWALSIPGLSGTGVVRVEPLLRLAPDQRISSFGLDSDGELLMCLFGKRAGVVKLRRRG